MRRIAILSVLAAFALSGSVVLAVDRLVPSHYPTIQAAINDAIDGDTVLVQPGRYYENINFLGKAITVRSTNPNDPNIVAGTIVDANGVGSVVSFANGEGRDSVLQGFTITGGIGTEWSADYYAGGGICCIAAAPSILQNIITGNSVSKSGGGLFCDVGSHVLLYKNTITDNSAESNGGGICTLAAQIEAQNNVICHNTARYRGGGIYLSQADYSTITGNTIAANYNKLYGMYGANLHIRLSENVTVSNNIIVNALSYGVGIYLSDSSILFKYNNVWNNAGGNYNGMSNPTGIDGNISDDPLFGPNSNDYHLQETSPCINAGDPAFIAEPGETDIDGEPRVRGGRIDIGADEFVVNLEPVADAGEDQTYSSIPSQVALDGSGSFDPGGDTISYHWTQIEGPAVALSDEHAVSPTFEALEFGIYVFELVVNDGLVDSSPDTVGIVVGDNHAPVADAGSSRYAGSGAVQLDGTGSYDPDGYGELTYQWQQISGPAVVITDWDRAMPTISGFAQTSSIQECEFELVVSDGDLISLPDTVKVIIVAAFGGNALRLQNPAFDPDKPTILGFGGGYDCDHGVKWRFGYEASVWYEKANVITTSGDWYRSRYKDYASMLIVYLSQAAPDYHQLIQTIGFSAGNGPAIAVANYLNLKYADARYAVNRVTLLDAACGDYPARVRNFLSRSVDGEQCCVDNYIATYGVFCPGALNIGFQTNPAATHWTPRLWYEQSIMAGIWDTDMYNQGFAGGAYVSVAGPAKNMQLASGTDYYFKWIGNWDDWFGIFEPGHLDFFNESLYPGTLPEPVTLIGPEDGAVVDANGAVLSCEESENAVGYRLLFGRDPYHVNLIISDTNGPPTRTITTFPYAETYWTVKARDQYGTTIFADPILIKAEDVTRAIDNPQGGEYLTCSGYELVSMEIVSPNECEYRFRMRIKNIGAVNAHNVITQVISTPPDTTAMNNRLFFGSIETGQEVLSENTFVIRMNCQSEADVNETLWQVSKDLSADADGDGMPDGWELDNGLLPWQDDSQADPDGDSLTNVDEYVNGCNPNDPDTDDDGLTDFEEVVSYGTDPLSADSDGDGLTDIEEVRDYGTDPLSDDSDEDGLTDFEEVNVYHTDPLSDDSDSDGMPDGWEVSNSLNPLAKNDCQADNDDDGLRNIDEYINGCNPNDSDSDNDGMSDDWEVMYGLNPVQDDAELDSDGDGYSNLIEFTRDSIPTDANSLPISTFFVPSDFNSVQMAIDSAIKGDTIVLEPGVYYESIDFNGIEELMIRSTEPEDGNVVAATVIDGAGEGPVVTFAAGEDASCVLAGLTITNGNYGVYCKSSSPTISKCDISENAGPGIRCRQSDATMINCSISDNGGAGIDSRSALGENGAVITCCDIVGNAAQGVHSQGSRGSISNCLIAGNGAEGINSQGDMSLIVANCTIVENAACGIYCERSRIIVTNSVIRENWPEQISECSGLIGYSNVEDGWPGQGNIDVDPCFVEPGRWIDVNDSNLVVEPGDPNAIWVEGDYHLLLDSLCIDAGDPNYSPVPNETDIDGQPRIIGGRVDIGADESVMEVAIRFTPQGLNAGSEGNWFKAHCVLPEGFEVEDVDTNSPVKIIGPFELECEYMNVFISDDGFVEVEAAFSRSDFCGFGPVDADIVVEGLLVSGQYFYGEDQIKIVTSNFKYLAVLTSHWLEADCAKPNWCSGLDLDQDGAVNFADFALFDGCCIEVVP
jgi:parallel beta-helix repeat protein